MWFVLEGEQILFVNESHNGKMRENEQKYAKMCKNEQICVKIVVRFYFDDKYILIECGTCLDTGETTKEKKIFDVKSIVV